MKKEDILKEFVSYVSKDRKKSINYLRNMSLSDDDAEDVFQKSCLDFYRNLEDGKLQTLTCKLSTYLNEICKRQALKFINSKKGKEVLLDIPEDKSRLIYLNDKLDEILNLVEEDNSEREENNRKVRDIVEHLPKQCNDIFWGMYRDGFSLKELYVMLGYASYDVVKVTRQRCIKKFIEKFKN